MYPLRLRRKPESGANISPDAPKSGNAIFPLRNIYAAPASVWGRRDGDDPIFLQYGGLWDLDRRPALTVQPNAIKLQGLSNHAMTALFLNRAAGVLHDDRARVFDTLARSWRRVPESAQGGAPVDLLDAVRWLQRESGRPVRAPVAVVGAREATAAQLMAAEALGARLAGLGLAVLCGGLAGVMTAVAKGAAEAGGVAIGLLPEADWRDANPYVTTVIATGVGLARNAIVAEAGLCVVAVGGGYDTMTEMAFGMQFARKVFALENAPEVKGAIEVATVDAAIEAVARVALNLDGAEKPWR